MVSILKHDNRICTHTPNHLGVVIPDIDMLVDLRKVLHSMRIQMTICVQVTLGEVEFGEALILSEVIVSGNNAGGHVVKAPFWYAVIEHALSQVRAPEADPEAFDAVGARLAEDRHVHPSKRREHCAQESC